MSSLKRLIQDIRQHFEDRKIGRDVAALARIKRKADFERALQELGRKIQFNTPLQQKFNQASFSLLPTLLRVKDGFAPLLFDVMGDYARNSHELKRQFVLLCADNVARVGARHYGSGMAVFCKGRSLSVEAPELLPAFAERVMHNLPAIMSANAAVGEEVMRYMLSLGHTHRALDSGIRFGAKAAIDKLRTTEKKRPFLAENLRTILSQGDHIYEAIVFEDMPRLEKLLAAKANPNLFIDKLGPALHVAIERQSLASVTTLLDHRKHLEYRASVNGQGPTGDRPLHVALHEKMTQRNMSIIQCLLDRGANPLLPDGNGISPLKLAALKGSVEVVKAMKAALEANRGRYQHQLQQLSKNRNTP